MSSLVYLLSPTNAETYRCNSCQSEFPVNKSARAGADAPDGSGWWHAAYFDLTERTDSIDAPAIESALRYGVN